MLPIWELRQTFATMKTVYACYAMLNSWQIFMTIAAKLCDESQQTALTQQGVVLSEDLWSHLSPFQWAHIHFNGSYRFTEVPLEEDFRPLREYHGARIQRSALESPSQETNSEQGMSPEQEDADELTPVQLAFLEEEKTES